MHSMTLWVATLALAGLTACAPSTAALRPLDERAVQARQALRGLSEDPFGAQVAPQLEQAQAWLSRYEARRAGEAPDADFLTLLMDAVDGQLMRAKAAQTKAAAEARLSERQAKYSKERARLTAVRQESARLKGEGRAR